MTCSCAHDNKDRAYLYAQILFTSTSFTSLSISVYYIVLILSAKAVKMGKTIRMPRGSPQYLKNLPNNLRVEPLSYEPYPKSKPKKATRKTSNSDKENADAVVKPKSRAKKASANNSSNVDGENTDANPEPKARAPKPKKLP